MATIARRQFNVTDYYRMAEVGILSRDDRVELIEGEVIAMSPIGALHAFCVDRINAFLTKCVGESAIVRVQSPIRLDDYSEPQPDVALLRISTDGYRYNHPKPDDIRLVVEVADTSYEYDHDIKVPLYARSGIPEVWLVALQSGEVEVYTRPVEGVYLQVEIVKPGQAFESQALDGLTIEVDGILS